MEQNNSKNKWSEYIRSFNLLLRLLRFCGRMAPKETVLVIGISSITGLTTLMVLFSLQHLIDTVQLVVDSGKRGYSPVIGWLSIFILTLLLSKVLHLVGNVITDHVQEIVKEKCQQEIIEKAYRLSLADFDQSSLYDQLKRVNQGMDRRFFTTMTALFRMITMSISAVSILFYLGLIHWSIPLILMVGSLVFTLVQVRVNKEKYMLHRKQTTPARKLQYLADLMTSRQAASELRLYGLEDYLLGEWNQLNEQLMDERMKLSRREYRLQLVSSSGHTFIFALILLGVVFLIAGGLLTIGKYAAFIRAAMSFQNELNMLMWTMAILHHDLRYIEDFFEYLDLQEENREGMKLPDHRSLKQGIQFRKVGFSYPGTTEKVLNNLDLHISSGEKIALIGDNGSGKSTLIKLLLGLYRPSEGEIRVDGRNLSEVNLNSWRSKTTAILQDFQKYHLLNVRENIAVGQIECMDDPNRVKKAAELSGAASMIDSLSEGYETLLGKAYGGQELSQGQWQKIAVVRAYIRNSELLVLDEPTASLDAKAEVEIYRQFEQVAKGKTVVFISHRLGVAKLADRIIVLKDGRIEEQGTHSELLKNGGHYARMYRVQSQWYNEIFK